MIVHTDPFTVGADTDFGSYGSWSAALGAAGAMRVVAATDRLETVTTNADHWCRWTGPGSPTGDQKIRARLRIENSGGGSHGACALLVRTDGVGNGYNGFWTSTPGGTGTVEFYRVTGDGTVFTFLDSGGTITGGNTYAGYFVARGAGAVVSLEAGDDINGAAVVTFDDSNAARHTSGLVAAQVYTNSATHAVGGGSPAWVDDVEIDNLVTGAKLRRVPFPRHLLAAC